MTKLDKYKNPITTQDNIRELQEILVQTCINYVKQHNLTDIDEIFFSVNGLSEDSYNAGKWMPSTDSSIEVIGIEHDNNIPIRALIGSWM